MKNLSIFFLIVTMCLSCAGPKHTTTQAGKQIFHVASDDWTTTGDADWVLSDGVLSATGVLGYAETTRPYKDFVLEVEFMPDAEVNSGIFIRCPQGEYTATGCYEMNIADNHQNQDFRTGAIVTKAKPMAIVNSVGKWNHYKIMAKGNHIQVWLNGIKTGDIKDDTAAQGIIGLQLNGKGKIQFRNVRILEI